MPVTFINDVCDRLGKLWRDLAGSCQMVQRFALVEARHFDCPFDHRPFAIDIKPLRSMRDWNDATINLRRVAPVDIDFVFAGALAFIERRIIQEGKPQCTLDLQHSMRLEEHDRYVGIDALRRAVLNPAAKKGKHRILVPVWGLWLGRIRHGRSTAAPTSFPSRSRASASLA